MIMSKEVTIPATYNLSGTLTIPEQNQAASPAILIIPGSGEIDRDGNTAGEPPINLYKEMAEWLAEQGYLSLRYDKRGLFKSEGEFIRTGFYDLIEDATACIQYLKGLPEADSEQIFMLGHSEGAIITPAIQRQQPVNGLILLSGLAESTIDLTNRQNDELFENIKQSKTIRGLLYRLFKLDALEKRMLNMQRNKLLFAKEDVVSVNGKAINVKYLREVWHYNVCDLLPEITCPVLTVTGENDKHVPPEHAQVIAEMVSGDGEWKIIAGVNHSLRQFEEQLSNEQETDYLEKQAQLPIAKDVLQTLSNWLDKQTRS